MNGENKKAPGLFADSYLIQTQRTEARKPGAKCLQLVFRCVIMR
nr:MAG TPA: hypothetical protein [Caudoviricetes sp.]